MLFPIFIMMIALTFAAQLWLCLRVKRRWIKLIPLCLIGVGELACGAAYILSDEIYGAAFAAVIYAVVLLIMLVGDALAWLIYVIVKKIQKSK